MNLQRVLGDVVRNFHDHPQHSSTPMIVSTKGFPVDIRSCPGGHPLDFETRKGLRRWAQTCISAATLVWLGLTLSMSKGIGMLQYRPFPRPFLQVEVPKPWCVCVCLFLRTAPQNKSVVSFWSASEPAKNWYPQERTSGP